MCLTAWKLPIARANWNRVPAYSAAIRIAAVRSAGLFAEQGDAAGLQRCGEYLSAAARFADQERRGGVQSERALLAGQVDGGQRRRRQPGCVPIDREYRRSVVGVGEHVDEVRGRAVEDVVLGAGQ